ncbi:MAG: adenine phosphoribosyltransferase [Pseudomonadota bacterium]
MDILSYFRVVTDFKPGVNFYDISTLMLDPAAMREVIAQLHERIEPYEPDLIMGIESRGFLLGTQLAQDLGVAYAMVRKGGKLPGETISEEYDLEYGSDTMEIQPDLVGQFSRVVIVDDLLATGGTMAAAEKLVAKAGADVVATACIIELDGLNGRDKLEAPFEALIKAPG